MGRRDSIERRRSMLGGLGSEPTDFASERIEIEGEIWEAGDVHHHALGSRACVRVSTIFMGQGSMLTGHAAGRTGGLRVIDSVMTVAGERHCVKCS